MVLLAADSNVPVYNPPKRRAPAGRVGGGTRGGRDVFVLSVLAPDHSGFTTNEQPTLYWYISNATTLPIELTLMDPAESNPSWRPDWLPLSRLAYSGFDWPITIFV